jgi:TRAP-type C4-dicarboxylate transport system permease small subunit
MMAAQMTSEHPVATVNFWLRSRRAAGRQEGETALEGTARSSRSHKVLASFSSALNVLSGIWLGSIAALILADVIGREVFGAPIYGTNEIVANSVLSILFLQLPLAILNRNSLRTTIVYGALGNRGKSLLNTCSYFIALLLFAAIGIGSWPNMIEAWSILEQEGSGIVTIPVYPIRTLVVVVSGICVLVCALLIYQSLFHNEEFDDD